MISREFIFKHLKEKQVLAGGYTGDNIIEIANILEVTWKGSTHRLHFFKCLIGSIIGKTPLMNLIIQ